jgi:hypothetical protein
MRPTSSAGHGGLYADGGRFVIDKSAMYRCELSGQQRRDSTHHLQGQR